MLFQRLGLGIAAAGLAALIGSAGAAAATIKIAVSEPLSGPFATLGPPAINGFKLAAEEIINKRNGTYKGNTKIEIVPYDNKISAKEALVNLQKAIDSGIRVIAQGQSSSIASALIGAVAKYNKRNPNDPVLYLNWAAVTPAFTNEMCSFSHFRFDAHLGMKLNAIVKHVSGDSKVRKIYLLNQNYAFGQAISKVAKQLIKEQLPNAEVVGDDLIPPFGRVKDFSPYVTKIKGSGADTVITGNWGLDLDRLLKAAFDANLPVQWLTFYAGANRAPGNIGKRGIGKVKMVSEWHNNELTPVTERFANLYKKKFGYELTFWRIVTTLEMLATAVDRAGSTNMTKVAKKLEGMLYKTALGEVYMRSGDHQLQQPMMISVLTDKVKYDMDGAGIAFKTVQRFTAQELEIPHGCTMQRPG